MLDEYHYNHTIQDHVTEYFKGHKIEHIKWTIGPIVSLFPEFRVLQISPGPKSDLWIYVSLGAWQITYMSFPRIEFTIFAPEKDLRHVELLTAVTSYHYAEHLALGHYFPIGEPWLSDSACTQMLVSLPHPLGQKFEICHVDDDHVHLLWLLPITEAEKKYMVANGQEELEKAFDIAEIEFWNPSRKSVV